MTGISRNGMGINPYTDSYLTSVQNRRNTTSKDTFIDAMNKADGSKNSADTSNEKYPGDVTIAYPPRTNNALNNSVVSQKSKDEMSLDEYKQWVMNQISQFPVSGWVRSTFSLGAIVIKEEAFERMKNDPEYENYVLNRVRSAYSVQGLCGDQSVLEKCQLLFLDINMEGMDGLKTAMGIREKYPRLPIVLVTAYMNYALDGYKVKASRFLLKDNLEDTIEECMDDLMDEMKRNSKVLEFHFVEGTIKLQTDDIIYIETERHKNVFYTEKGVFQIYRKLDELENELKDMGFVRAHQSFLVNMRYIAKISSYVMTLTTGKKISTPKARYAKVKREYMLYKGE